MNTERIPLDLIEMGDRLRAVDPDHVLMIMADAEIDGIRQAIEVRPAKVKGRYGKVGRALWLTGWNLGVVRDRTDLALLAFVERQTGISQLSWVRDAKEGRQVMEALKKWISRQTNLVWPTETYARRIGKSVARARKEAVHEIQHRILGETWTLIPATVTDEELDRRIAAMGRRVRTVQGIGKTCKAA